MTIAADALVVEPTPVDPTPVAPVAVDPRAVAALVDATPADAGDAADQGYSLEDVCDALDAIGWFKLFLLDRFGAWTRSGPVRDTSGRIVDPIADPHALTRAGRGKWHVARGWEDFARGIVDEVVIRHYVEDEHGGGFTRDVVVPGAFVRDTTDGDPDYEAYLALRARFDPDHA